MPGSYLPDSDSETEYRVTEAVSGSYVQVGDTKKETRPMWMGPTLNSNSPIKL